jgi:hypothetical protein
MNSRIHAIGALALIMSTAPALAQTLALPFSQSSTLPPNTASPIPPGDPNAPRWMLLEGYGSHGELRQHWQLVRPEDFDVTNYHGFHTGTN